MDLTRNYHDDVKKRTLTADNYFSSISLVNQLNQKNISYVGTLRKNKTVIPYQLLPDKKRKAFSTVFGFNGETTIVSYVPKPNRCVILISSEHHDKKIDEEGKLTMILIIFHLKFNNNLYISKGKETRDNQVL